MADHPDRTGLEIAVIGLAGRFPGASNVEELWKNLREGRESISFFSDEQLISSGIPMEVLRDPAYVRATGVLADSDKFDARFFGYNPREAEVMDPQQRIFLECASEAIERAGYDTETYQGRIGVFAGVGLNTYWANVCSRGDVLQVIGGFQAMLGNDKDFLASRVSYELDLKGPSITVQTACSTSLVAVHLACQALLTGECDIALAGGVSVRAQQIAGYVYRNEGIMSPDGHCRAFDANARGTVGGNGVGIVVLKRLQDAGRDNIRALITGSAVNNDGSQKMGFTAPSVEGQARVIRMAQDVAGVSPESVTYIEAHGTGTALGDPIEVESLSRAFRSGTSKKQFCAIGTIKSNVGHLDTAAGVAGLIKTVLALNHRQIPASLHFERPNPEIDFANSPFFVNASLLDWPPAPGFPRRAGVSSFGIGGTNAHVVLEEAPVEEASDETQPHQLLLLSAKTRSALDTAGENLRAFLSSHRDVNLGDVAYTLAAGRRALAYRKAWLCTGVDDAIAALGSPAMEPSASRIGQPRDWPVVMMFPGQGSQHAGMGAGLYRTNRIFREQLDRCFAIVKRILGFDPGPVMFSSDPHCQEQLNRTSITQPVLFALEYSLAQVFVTLGIMPDAMIGHSVGEYVAACLAGVMTLETALHAAGIRGRLMEAAAEGRMLAAVLSEDEASRYLSEEIWLSAVNGPRQSVLAGSREATEELKDRLTGDGVCFRELRTSRAFHSGLMKDAVAGLVGHLKTAELSRPRIRFVSNVSGTWITPEEAVSAEYWGRQMLVTVRFWDGLRTALEGTDKILMDIGPGEIAGRIAKSACRPNVEVISTMRRADSTAADERVLAQSIARLWLAGRGVAWERHYEGERRKRLELPTYPFERQRYWIEALEPAAQQQQAAVRKREISDWFYIPYWKRMLTPIRARTGSTRTWILFADESGIGRRMARRLRAEGKTAVLVDLGVEYARRSADHHEIRPEAAEDYDRVVREVEPDVIVHLWGITREEKCHAESQERGFYSLLEVARVLARNCPGKAVNITLVTSGMQSVGGEAVISAAKATVLGPVKVIGQEYRNVRCKSIDLCARDVYGDHTEELIDWLIAEAETQSDGTVAYRGRQRWIQHYEPAALNEDPGGATRLRTNGVYLITGGLGRLGLALARYLADRFHARVILVSRRQFPPRDKWTECLTGDDIDAELKITIEALLQIEKTASALIIRSGDAGNEEDMGAIIRETVSRFSTIHGVICAAGIVGRRTFRTIQETKRSDADEIVYAKTHGLYVMERVLRGVEPDFVLCISSLSSILGGIGFAAYAAGNCFMDAFAVQRNQSGRAPWITVNLDALGFAAPANQSDTMVGAISLSYIGPLVERLLFPGITGQVIVSTEDLTARRMKWLEPSQSQLPFDDVHAKPAPGDLKDDNGDINPRNDVEAYIAGQWSLLLGIKHISVNDNFFELGGHSLLATQLTSRLRSAFHVDLNLRHIFERPTVTALAEEVDRLCSAKHMADLERILSDVERLGEEEADVELSRELQRNDS